MHLLTVVGARPQFVKAAALSRALAERAVEGVRHTLVHTGQHYDASMSERFFDELQLPPPDHHLEVGSGSHGAQTGLMLERIERVLVAEAPDVVIAYGDTNSTLAAALAASKLHRRVAHVEAGLRSFDRRMPEEINRVVADHLADDLFCPSQVAVDNLASEGITEGVHLVGDVMYDVLRWQLRHLDDAPPADLCLPPGTYVLVTVHRAANTDDRAALESILSGLEALASSGLDVVFPVHPRTRPLLLDRSMPPRIHLVEPIGHRDCLRLARDARAVLTDSGGLQKEAFWLGTPCVTLREETEWPETVRAGWNRLVGTDPERMVAAVEAEPPSVPPPPVYGDGTASERILDVLLR